MENKVCNPRQLSGLWDEREIGDPFLMRHDGRFYLYCSSRGAAGIKCWVSEDMIRFTYYGFVCEDPRIFGAYAPEVAYNAGKFWMVTSPLGSGHYLLCADSPLGPFEIMSDNLGIGIDGSLFVDDDGRSWFYRASHQGIRVHEMPSPDEIDVRSKPISASYLGHWTEGPQVIKHDGRYFLTDTGNHVLSRGYHVDYCVSHEGPDRGYRRTRDSILLLETRDEYHALGHSSTCVGPDMDTMYIIYHKNILDEWNRPLFRSMNIDRLHFNGDRMYCNATWWEQPAPTQPICTSRNGNGLVDHPLGRALPLPAGETYTAELNLWLRDEVGSVFFSADGRKEGRLILHRDRYWQCIADENRLEGVLPANVDMNALLTVKVSMYKGRLVLYINGMVILRQKTELRGGAIGFGNGCTPSFVGFSEVAQGSQDGVAAKAVPGAFDAVHQMEAVGQMAQGEQGSTALLLQNGETAKYLVNVWKTQEYHLSLTMRVKPEDVRLCVNGLFLTAKAGSASTEDGMEKRYCGVLRLPAGEHVLEISADQDVAIDRFYLQEADTFAAADIIIDGADVTDGALRVLGHKAGRSMHHKFCGYTAAEGYGEAWFGGNWRDCELRMIVNMKPCSPEARVSAYLRSSRESWHPQQVAAGRRAYALHVFEHSIVLAKQEYGETVLAQMPLNVEWGDQLRLTFRVQDNCVSVLSDEGVLLQFNDPVALTCGRVGIDAVTDGMGFEKLSLREVAE